MTKETPQFIAALSVTFPMDGHDVTVVAANVGQLGRMLDLLSPVLADLVLLPPDMLDRMVGDQGPTHGDVLEILETVSKHEGLATQLVAVGMGWPHERVAQLLPDRFAYLFAVLVQVNADFFVRARPVLTAAAGKFSALLPERPALQPSEMPGPASSAS